MAIDKQRRALLWGLGSAPFAALPHLARAQKAGRIPRVGYLWHAGSAEEEGPYYKALIEGFERLGYVHPRNIILEHRFPNEVPERFRAMAADLVALNCDVLMGGNAASLHLKRATSTIPIVFMFVADPIGMGLIDSLSRPGGNATGFSSVGKDVVGKRMEFLKEAWPGLSRVGLLINPEEQTSQFYIGEFQAAAAQLGLTLQTFQARSLAELEPAFDAMSRAGTQALNLTHGGIGFQAREIAPQLAKARGIAVCAYSRETFEHGALMSYGADQIDICRRSATYADRIIKGTKPSDLPVEQPKTFEFLINLRVARELGLTIPTTLLVFATETID